MMEIHAEISSQLEEQLHQPLDVDVMFDVCGAGQELRIPRMDCA